MQNSFIPQKPPRYSMFPVMIWKSLELYFFNKILMYLDIKMVEGDFKVDFSHDNDRDFLESLRFYLG